MLNKIVKIKNPSLPFQEKLRYKVTKENKTTIHCRVVEKINGVWVDKHHGKDYRGVKKNLIETL